MSLHQSAILGLTLSTILIAFDGWARDPDQKKQWDPSAPPGMLVGPGIDQPWSGRTGGTLPATAAAPTFRFECKTRLQDWAEATNRLSRIGSQPPCSLSAQDLNLKLTRLHILAVQEQESEALSSFVFMNGLYGNGRSLTRAEQREQLCRMMGTAVTDAIASARKSKTPGSKELKSSLAVENGCSHDPLLLKRVENAIDLANSKLKSIGFDPDKKGDLSYLNDRIRDLQTACEPIYRRWQEFKVLKDSPVDNEADRRKKEADLNAYLDLEKTDFPPAREAIRKIFGSYYGRLIAASPELMATIGFDPTLNLNDPAVCHTIGRTQLSGVSQQGVVKEEDLTGSMKDSKKVSHFETFRDAIRKQLAKTAGERITELKNFNRPDNLKEKVLFEFIYGNQDPDSEFQKTLARQPELARVLCEAKNTVEFWNDPQVQENIKNAKSIAAVASMAGGIVLAPWTLGNSVAAALTLAGTLALNEGIYAANDLQMASDQSRAGTRAAESIRRTTGDNLDARIEHAGKIQQNQNTSSAIKDAREEADQNQRDSRFFMAATAASGFAVGQLMGAASEFVAAESTLGRVLGSEIALGAGAKFGVGDVADQLLVHSMTGQWNVEGFVLDKVAHGLAAGVNRSASVNGMLKAKFPDLKEGEVPTVEQRRSLAYDLYRAKYKIKSGETPDFARFLEIEGVVNREVLGASPENVNRWISGVQKNGTDAQKGALGDLMNALRGKDPDVVARILGDAYVVHLTGNPSIGSKGNKDYTPADIQKLRALGVFGNQLKQAGIKEEDARRLVRNLAENKVLGVFEKVNHFIEESQGKKPSDASVNNGDYEAFQRAYQSRNFSGDAKYVSYTPEKGDPVYGKIAGMEGDKIIIESPSGTRTLVPPDELIRVKRSADAKTVFQSRKRPPPQPSRHRIKTEDQNLDAALGSGVVAGDQQYISAVWESGPDRGKRHPARILRVESDGRILVEQFTGDNTVIRRYLTGNEVKTCRISKTSKNSFNAWGNPLPEAASSRTFDFRTLDPDLDRAISANDFSGDQKYVTFMKDNAVVEAELVGPSTNGQMVGRVIVEENGQPVEKQILIGADELRTARISPGSKKRFKISGNRPPAGGINKPPGRFSPWTMNSATSSLPLKDTDFLPPDYLKRLSDAGGKVTVTTIPSGGQYGGFDVSIDLALNGEKQNLIRFSVEGRSDRSSVQVENLRLSSPDALEPKGRLRSAQEKKGLPADVGRFFSRQLFEFLQAGSYKNIVVEGTTDYLVWKTYQMNGAKPAYPEGVKMTAYLDEIYKSKNPALAEHLTSVSDFANLTNPVRSLKSVSDHNLFSTIESEWKSLQAQGKESSSTISPIRDSKGTTIGFDYKVPDGTKKTFLIAPFLPDHPIIDWAHLWMTNPRAVTLNKSLK